MRTTTIFIGFVAVLIVCSQTASAQGFVFPLKGVALDVMNANPFLKEGVGDMPPLRSKKVQRVGYMDEEWDEPIAGVSLDECSYMVHLHLGIGWDRRPLCVVIGIRGATHKYEEAYNNVRRYEAPLYPNTPRIQRVYSMNPGVKLPPDDPKRNRFQFAGCGAVIVIGS